MKVRRGYARGEEVPLIKALTETIEGDDYMGAMEQAARTADGAAKMVATLVSIIHQRGLLSKNDLSALLDSSFVITED